MSTVGSERQHQAARALIAQIVKNSDLYGADAIEEERLTNVGQDEDGLDSERGLEQAFESHRDSEYSGGVSSAGAGHRDQVQAAFENYGQITEEILAEWKEMFSLFDFDNTGFVKTDDLGTVLRGLGRNLTESTIGTFINSYDSNGAGKIDFPTFYRLMTEESPMPGPCHEAQVLLDFHVFDMHRDGFIPVVDLVHLLRNLGEPLTRDDVDCLLAELYIDGDNKINIKDLVRHMFTTSAPNPE